MYTLHYWAQAYCQNKLAESKEKLMSKPSQPMKPFNGVCKVPNWQSTRVGTMAKALSPWEELIASIGAYMGCDDDYGDYIRYLSKLPLIKRTVQQIQRLQFFRSISLTVDDFPPTETILAELPEGRY